MNNLNLNDFDSNFWENQLQQPKSEKELFPRQIKPGVFEKKILRGDETVFLRMEAITQENTSAWEKYIGETERMSDRKQGLLNCFVRNAGIKEVPSKEKLGFEPEEYEAYKNKVIALREKTNHKISKLLEMNMVGRNEMSTSFFPGELHFVVYATKNPDFSIEEVNKNIAGKELSLKEYIDAFGDVLISFGSNFSYDEKSFCNRGIFRNPVWLIEEKYAGLSMLLHGLTGAVAKKFYPEKEEMIVNPTGSMQVIIQKALKHGEGYALDSDTGEKIDIKDIVAVPDGSQGDIDHIKINALCRILFEQTGWQLFQV